MCIKVSLVIEYTVDGEYEPKMERLLTDLISGLISSSVPFVLHEDECILFPRSIEVVEVAEVEGENE